jgi:hypothetical protein
VDTGIALFFSGDDRQSFDVSAYGLSTPFRLSEKLSGSNFKIHDRCEPDRIELTLTPV